MNKILVFTMIFAMSCAAFGQTWQIPQGSATIDADLSDWAGANWINMNYVSEGNPDNLSNTKMAVRWDVNNIYMAVKYDDSSLHLSQGCIDWNGQDDIEVYINANNDNATAYDAAGWVTAQHYFIGANGTSPTSTSCTPATPAGSWYNLASSHPLPDAVNWPNAVIDVATKVTGNSLVYEMRLPALNDMATGSLQTLTVGDTVGVDVIAADKGIINYGWLGLNMDGGKFADASKFQDWELVTEVTPPAAVHYTFKETAPGTWEVLVDVTGEDTAGLSAYEVWVDGVDPSTVIFDQNILGTVASSEYVGFSPGNLLHDDIAGSFNAGNYQGSGDKAIEGIGMVDVLVGNVELDAQALLGTLTTEAGLTEENFRVTSVGLLNSTGDGFFDARYIIPTLEVIPLDELLEGDANRDGVVSAGDYAAVQANFGNTGEAGLLGDANGDGVVSAGDYASVQANFGNTSASSVVPEPATMCLLAIGGTALLRRKWR